jgi:hypothetical protein
MIPGLQRARGHFDAQGKNSFLASLHSAHTYALTRKQFTACVTDL